MPAKRAKEKGPPPESCRAVGTRVNRQEHHEEGERRAGGLPPGSSARQSAWWPAVGRPGRGRGTFSALVDVVGP